MKSEPASSPVAAWSHPRATGSGPSGAIPYLQPHCWLYDQLVYALDDDGWWTVSGSLRARQNKKDPGGIDPKSNMRAQPSEGSAHARLRRHFSLLDRQTRIEPSRNRRRSLRVGNDVDRLRALKPSSRPDQRNSVRSRPGSAKMVTACRL